VRGTTPLWFTAPVIEPGEWNDGAGDGAGDAVVRPLSRAARRPCARPGCPSPAHASLVFSYRSREAWLDQLGDPAPQSYDLCAPHAARTTAPRGWQLRDRRPVTERADDDGVAATGPPPLGGEHTVAVLAAALRAVPDLPASPEEPSGPDEPATTNEDAPSPVLGHGAALPDGSVDGSADRPAPASPPAPGPSPKPILAARPRLPFPPAPGSRADDW
jgi:hypothetical protein